MFHGIKLQVGHIGLWDRSLVNSELRRFPGLVSHHYPMITQEWGIDPLAPASGMYESCKPLELGLGAGTRGCEYRRRCARCADGRGARTENQGGQKSAR